MAIIPKRKPFDASQVADAIGPGRFESELITQEAINEGGLESSSPEPTRKSLAGLTIAEATWKRIENEKFASMQSFAMPGEGDNLDSGLEWWNSLGSVEGAEETETFKAFQDIHANLSPEEKEAFEFFRLNRFPGFIDKHDRLSQEKEANAVLFSHEQSVAASLETAVANLYDPLVIEEELSSIIESTLLMAHDQGFSVEQLNQTINENTSTLHVGLINEMLNNNDPHGAKKQFEENLGQISPDQQLSLDNLIEDKVLFFDTQLKVEEVMQLPWEKQRFEIDKIEDEVLREKVLKGYHHRLQDEAEEREALQREFSGAIMDEMSKSAGKFSDNEIAAIPADQWAQLNPQSRDMIKRYADKKDDVVPDNLDSGSYGQIWNVLAEDPEAFLKLNIRGNYVGQLSKAHQDEFREKQVKYNTATPEEKKSMLAKDKLIADMLKTWTLIGSEHYEITGDFLNDFNKRLRDEKDETGEEPSLARFKKILDETEDDHLDKLGDHLQIVASGKHTLDGIPSNILIERGLDKSKIYRQQDRDKLKELILDEIIDNGEGLERKEGLNEIERNHIMEGVLTDMVNVNTSPSSISTSLIEKAVKVLGPDIGIRKMPWANYNLLSKEQKERAFVTITSIDQSGHLKSFPFHMGQLANLNKKTRKKIKKLMFEKGIAPNRQNQVLEYLRMKNPNIEYRAPSFAMKLRLNLEVLTER